MTRKRRIGTIGAVFLALMLLLTFFSNTIFNSTLPVVRTKTVTGGTITPAVTGSGTVEPADESLLLADRQLTVLAVCVQPGEAAAAGAALLRVNYEDDGALALLQQQLKTAEDTYTSMMLSAQVPSGSANSATLQQLQNNLTIAQQNQTRCDAYLEARSALDAALSTAQSALETAQVAYNDGTAAAQTEFDAADQENAAASEALTLAEANEAYAKTLFDADPAQERAYLDAQTAREQAAARANAAQNRFFSAQQALQAAQQLYAPALENAQAALGALESQAASLEQEYAGCTDYLTCENAVLAAQASIASFYDSLAAAEVSDEQQALELQNQEEAIEDLRKEIDALEAELGEQTLTADADGTVETVYVREGAHCLAGEQLLQLEHAASGCAVRVSVPAKEAALLQIGTPAAISGSGGKLATLTQIIAGESESQLIFQLNSTDAAPGQAVTLTISLNGGRYETVVPNSAVFEDAQGTFVFTLTFARSILGSRCQVTRVPVQVLAEDSQYSAVDGALSPGDTVVLYASEPLQDNQLVRLEE